MPHIKAHKRSWDGDLSLLRNHLLPGQTTAGEKTREVVRASVNIPPQQLPRTLHQGNRIRDLAREHEVLATLPDDRQAELAGQTLDDAVARANRGAGIVVGKFGTATVSQAELSVEEINPCPP